MRHLGTSLSVVTGTIVMACLAGGCRSQQVTPTTIDVSGSEGVCNLGNVTAGSKHAITFTIRNAADRALQIQKIRSDCACATIVSQPDKVDAHGTGAIEVVYEAPPTPMAYEDRLLVQTDDPSRQNIWLVIKSRTVGQPKQ